MTRVLVIQTAFAGDLILALPLVQEAARLLPGARIDLLCIPATATLVEGHPDVHELIVYNKRGRESMTALARRLRATGYSLVLCPHRSVRSALLAFATGTPRRVAFDRSAGRWLFTDTVPYRQDAHEVQRNLDLLACIDARVDRSARPILIPSPRDVEDAARFVSDTVGDTPYVCLAPGSVWATKRWTIRGFAETAQALSTEHAVILIGGPDDAAVCAAVEAAAGPGVCVNAAGVLRFPSTAALIARARLLVSNDSAPVHIAVAVGTPVVDIYGPTAPRFGFAPYGVPHEIVERTGLSCRPCAIHGGNRCPIGTFECMDLLGSDRVVAAARRLLAAGTSP